MRLDLPPSFFLGAYVRLAQLGGLGLFVLGAGAAFQAPAYGVAQAAAGLILFVIHLWWQRRLAPAEHDAFLRRAYVTLGALAFLAGAALFAPLTIARASSGASPGGEVLVALLSLALLAAFGRALALGG